MKTTGDSRVLGSAWRTARDRDAAAAALGDFRAILLEFWPKDTPLSQGSEASDRELMATFSRRRFYSVVTAVFSAASSGDLDAYLQALRILKQRCSERFHEREGRTIS